MTVPAGFDWSKTINSDGWAGFIFVGTFPGIDLQKTGR